MVEALEADEEPLISPFELGGGQEGGRRRRRKKELSWSGREWSLGTGRDDGEAMVHMSGK